jgi:hypothetical protein
MHWGIGVYATLDRPPPDLEARHIAHTAAGDQLLMVTTDGHLFGITAASDHPDGLTALTSTRDAVASALADAGYQVIAWEAGEYVSPAETERRLAAASNHRAAR